MKKVFDHPGDVGTGHCIPNTGTITVQNFVGKLTPSLKDLDKITKDGGVMVMIIPKQFAKHPMTWINILGLKSVWGKSDRVVAYSGIDFNETSLQAVVGTLAKATIAHTPWFAPAGVNMKNSPSSLDTAVGLPL